MISDWTGFEKQATWFFHKNMQKDFDPVNTSVIFKDNIIITILTTMFAGELPK
jgi:hypothetical protein